MLYVCLDRYLVVEALAIPCAYRVCKPGQAVRYTRAAGLDSADTTRVPDDSVAGGIYRQMFVVCYL